MHPASLQLASICWGLAAAFVLKCWYCDADMDCVLQAIHKQSFKQRQRGQGASKDKGVWAMLQTDITASAAPAAAPPSAPPAPAAAAAASSDVETAQMDAAGGAADGVAAQVYEALAVWPPSLHYLAHEAAKSLLLPRL
jgi:hypothetical protein